MGLCLTLSKFEMSVFMYVSRQKKNRDKRNLLNISNVDAQPACRPLP